MRFLGSGDCPTDSYVLPNLKIRTKRPAQEGCKLQSPRGHSPEPCVQGRWRAVATAFSGPLHKSLRSTVLAWNARDITGTVAATELTFSAMTAFPAVPAFSTQSPTPSASDLPDAGLLHPYEPTPATFGGNLRQRACAWHRTPYESRCSVASAHDQGCPMDF
jgi:hypothetical protein